MRHGVRHSRGGATDTRGIEKNVGDVSDAWVFWVVRGVSCDACAHTCMISLVHLCIYVSDEKGVIS